MGSRAGGRRFVRTLQATLVAVATVPASAIVAAPFGALHNQGSFTISPDYFRAFKFHQFDIAPALPERLGAAIVGVGATWWMGILIGVPVALVGLAHRDVRQQARASVRAVGGALALTAAFSVSGWLLGMTGLLSLDVQPSRYPGVIHDPAAFARAGIVHNCSYLGGFLAIFIAPAISLRARRRVSAASVIGEGVASVETAS
jgi:hypothetical protein